jgi:hypothetical protein
VGPVPLDQGVQPPEPSDRRAEEQQALRLLSDGDSRQRGAVSELYEPARDGRLVDESSSRTALIPCSIANEGVSSNQLAMRALAPDAANRLNELSSASLKTDLGWVGA